MEEKEQNSYQIVNQLYIEAIKNKKKSNKQCLFISKYWKITTSTGEPIQTAKNPAPRPARRWVTTLSVNPGIFKIVCIKKIIVSYLKT